MGFGPVAVRIGAKVPRIACLEHGVVTAAVPWARHGSPCSTFSNIDTMISLVMLFCSSIEIPWPGRKRNTPTNTGV